MLCCRVAAFPIGIDPERFTNALEAEEVQQHIAKLLNRYAGRKVRGEGGGEGGGGGSKARGRPGLGEGGVTLKELGEGWI